MDGHWVTQINRNPYVQFFTCSKLPVIIIMYFMFCFRILFKNVILFQRLQLDRVRLHLSKRTTYAQTQQCAERLLLLGQTDQAVQLLLETESENSNFYEDCLRLAMLICKILCETYRLFTSLRTVTVNTGSRVSFFSTHLSLFEKSIN